MRETGKQRRASFEGRKAALSEWLASEVPSTSLIKWQEKPRSGPHWEEVLLSGSARPAAVSGDAQTSLHPSEWLQAGTSVLGSGLLLSRETLG